MGSNVLGMETKITWATPGNFTVINTPCYEDGSNCGDGNEIFHTQFYVDPSQKQLKTMGSKEK